MLKLWWIMEKRKVKNFFTGLLITLIVVGGVFLNTKLIFVPIEKGAELPKSYICGFLLTLYEVIILYSIYLAISSLIENIIKKKRMRKKIFYLLNIDTKNYECEKYVSELIETFGLKDRFCLHDIPKELGVLFKEKLSNYNSEEILKIIKVVEKSEDDLAPDTIVNNFNKFFDTNFKTNI